MDSLDWTGDSSVTSDDSQLQQIQSGQTMMQSHSVPVGILGCMLGSETSTSTVHLQRRLEGVNVRIPWNTLGVAAKTYRCNWETTARIHRQTARTMPQQRGIRVVILCRIEGKTASLENLGVNHAAIQLEGWGLAKVTQVVSWDNTLEKTSC